MAFLLFLSLLPTFVILFYIYSRKKYEQEPTGLLIKSFILGALSTLPVIVFNLLAGIDSNTGNHFTSALIESFLTAAVPEELSKFLMLYLLVWNDRNFYERFDGIIYSVFISMGFATLENVVYVLNSGMGTAISRAITAVPAHALFGVAMGFYFSYAKFLPERKNYYLFKCIALPVLMHGFYDFILMWQVNLFQQKPVAAACLSLIFLVFLILLWIQGFKKIKKLSSDFYFRGIPQNEIEEYRRINTDKTFSIPENDFSKDNKYRKYWFEIAPSLLESEKSKILSSFSDAHFDCENGIFNCTVKFSRNFDWLLHLTYAINYRKISDQLRIYLIEPDLNNLLDSSFNFPYVLQDSEGCFYLSVSPKSEISGEKTIVNAIGWLSGFEDWLDGKIDKNEFKLAL